MGALAPCRQMYLARALAQFQLSHPELEINLTADDRLVDPIAGEFDLIVRISRLKNEEFVAKLLLGDRLVVAGSPGYFERRGRPRRSEDLIHHHCLHYSLVELGAEWRFRGVDKKPVPTGGEAAEMSGWQAPRPLTPFRQLVAAALPYLPLAPWGKVLRDLEVPCRRAKVTCVSPNNLRSSQAAMLAKAGVAPDVIRRLLGHTSLRLVERVYVRPSAAIIGEQAEE